MLSLASSQKAWFFFYTFWLVSILTFLSLPNPQPAFDIQITYIQLYQTKLIISKQSIFSALSFLFYHLFAEKMEFRQFVLLIFHYFFFL